MDAGAVVRAARRASSESQAAFAARAGISERTLSALESGRTDPRWGTVARLVEAAGLELTVVLASPPSDHALRDHLRRSTAYRLRWSLTPPGATWCLAQWQELGRVSTRGRVRLDGAQAVGVWLPVRRSTPVLPVVLHEHGDRADEHVGDRTPHLRVELCPDRPPLGLVPVAVARGSVLVPTPLQLAGHPACEQWAARLRTAAALLAQDGARDLAGRRAPAHRDPCEDREADEVLHRPEHRDRAWPSPYDSRAWRLGGSVGLTSWLQSHPA